MNGEKYANFIRINSFAKLKRKSIYEWEEHGYFKSYRNVTPIHVFADFFSL